MTSPSSPAWELLVSAFQDEDDKFLAVFSDPGGVLGSLTLSYAELTVILAALDLGDGIKLTTKVSYRERPDEPETA